MKKFFRKIWQGIKRLLMQLKDKTNIVIFTITFLTLSSEVWVMYLMYVLTGNTWFLGIGSACWAFWLAPLTPFLPLCFAITFAIRKIYDKIIKRKEKRECGKTQQQTKT